MFVEFVKDYKEFKAGDVLKRPEFALEEYLAAGVVKEVEKPPEPEPEAAPAPKRRTRAKK